jgi:hypothetical protein
VLRICHIETEPVRGATDAPVEGRGLAAKNAAAGPTGLAAGPTAARAARIAAAAGTAAAAGGTNRNRPDRAGDFRIVNDIRRYDHAGF